MTLQFSQQLDPRKEIQSEIVREVSSGKRIYLISGRYCIAQYLFLFTRKFRACLPPSTEFKYLHNDFVKDGTKVQALVELDG